MPNYGITGKRIKLYFSLNSKRQRSFFVPHRGTKGQNVNVRHTDIKLSNVR